MPTSPASSAPRERMLVAGCGDLGARLGERLAGQGHRVFGLRRRPERVPAPLEPLGADLLKPDELAGRLPEGLTRVFFILTPDRYDGPGYEAAFVTAQRHLIDALHRQSAELRRYVFVSSTSVYGQHAGEWVDEDSPAEPTRATGAALLEGEAVAGAAPWTSTVVRFAGIYGGGRDALVRKVLRGEPCRAGHYTNRIHRDDAVGVLAHLASDGTPPGTYLGVDHEPAPQCAVMGEIARRLGVTAPRLSSDPATTPRAGSKRCSSRRLLATGYAFVHPTYREGYAAELSAGDRNAGKGCTDPRPAARSTR